MSDPRCLSSAEVRLGMLKRCTRAVGHREEHLWVSAVDVVGSFTVARWDDQKRVSAWTVGDVVTASEAPSQRHWWGYDEGSAGTPMRFCRRANCDREVWEGDPEPGPDEPCPSNMNWRDQRRGTSRNR